MAAYVGTLRELLPGTLGSVPTEVITFTDAFTWSGAQVHSGAFTMSGALTSSGGYTITGTGTIGNGLTVTTPVIVGATVTGAASLTGTATLAIGTSRARLTHTQGTPQFSQYTTAASTHTSNSVQPFIVDTVMTGVGGVGGRAFFQLTTNVALGAWANALKAQIDRQTNGRATGLMSVAVLEMIMPASAIGSGTTAMLELEIVCPASFVADGSAWSAINITTSGATKTEFDDHGVLFDISGVASTAGGFWYDSISGVADEHIKVLTPSGVRYIGLSDSQTWT